MSNSRKNNTASTKKLTVCAMLSALGVVLLYIGSFVEVMDISMAVIASLFCVIAVIEYGKSAPWMIYGVTSVLALILLPNKTPAAFYAFFFGFYPVLKEKLEKLPRVPAWVLKLVIFNICFVLIIIAAYVVMWSQSDVQALSPILLGVMAVLAQAVFVLYDIALTRLISFYIVKLRNKLKL